MTSKDAEVENEMMHTLLMQPASFIPLSSISKCILQLQPPLLYHFLLFLAVWFFPAIRLTSVQSVQMV